MRKLVIAIATWGLFAAAAQAADKAADKDGAAMSPIVTQFPDTTDNFHLYMFTLKGSAISYLKSSHEFCAELHYGDAVMEKRSKSLKGDKIVDELEWVICGYKNQ
jgi:hypothetical protein